MAVADLIGAAIGVLLLVIVAYLLVGSTMIHRRNRHKRPERSVTLQDADTITDRFYHYRCDPQPVRFQLHR